MTTEVPKLLLSTREAAVALSISPRLLWSLTVSGEIPCCRVRRRVLYSPDDLAAWIESQKQRGKQ